MRKKELKLIVTFHTTADAMAMEKCCKEHQVPGRLIPVPQGNLSWVRTFLVRGSKRARKGAGDNEKSWN